MNETKHQPPQVERSQFTSYKPNRVCTEASDLQWDLIPKQFQMIDGKGRAVTFNYILTQRNGEGETLWYEYFCPETKEVAKIFND